MLNENERKVLREAAYFSAVRGRTARDRKKEEFDTIAEAEEFAASFCDGRTMIYAVCADGRSAHIRNA
jgi:hypothetical protein